MCVLKSYFNHCFCRFTNFYNGGEECMVPLSLFADPERILRRLYVFAEEPCKSTTTTSEPCSPVFKEVQPRPSEHSKLEYHTNNLNLYLHVFGLLIIYCCNKASNRIVTKSKELVFYSWKPLSPEASTFSPYTHAQHRTRTSRTFYTFAVTKPLNYPSLFSGLLQPADYTKIQGMENSTTNSTYPNWITYQYFDYSFDCSNASCLLQPTDFFTLKEMENSTTNSTEPKWTTY